MAFRIKDLMINDLSEAGGYQGPFNPIPTCGPRSLALCIAFTDLVEFDLDASLESVKALKEQLKQQLEEIQPNLQPQTVEEVDKLSAKLTEALEVLREHRAKLAKS